MDSPVAEALRAIAGAFRRLGLDWYLFDAQAAILRGSRRLTEDIGVTVMAGALRPDVLLEACERTDLRMRFAPDDDFIARTRVLPLVHGASKVPVDVVLGGPGLEEHILASAERATAAGVDLLLPTAVHLIAVKLLAGRPRDLEDSAAMARAGAVPLDEVAELVDEIARAIGDDRPRQALGELRDRLDRDA
ncbi:MAG: hypothetical protein AAGA20_01460 [Planctomycetota bacterium]